jgi:hypothetical protein
MADKELEKANKGYKQHYEDERKENEETREMIAGPLRALKNKIKEGVTDKKDYSNYNFPGMAKSVTEMYEAKAKEKAEKDEINKSLDGNASTRTRLNMGKLPEKAANMKKGGMVGSASKRADGCAIKGKTKGRIV